MRCLVGMLGRRIAIRLTVDLVQHVLLFLDVVATVAFMHARPLAMVIEDRLEQPLWFSQRTIDFLCCPVVYWVPEVPAPEGAAGGDLRRRRFLSMTLQNGPTPGGRPATDVAPAMPVLGRAKERLHVA